MFHIPFLIFLAEEAIGLNHDFIYVLSSAHCCVWDFVVLPSFAAVFAQTFPWSAAAFPKQASEVDLGKRQSLG